MAETETSERKNLPAAQRTLIASARNDITIPRFNTVMQPLDETLLARGGGKGLALYDEIERDTHAYAVLQKRKLALVAREWEVEPASDDALDQRAAEFVNAQLLALPFDQICLDLLDATLKGFAVSEIVWQKDGAAIVPERVISHDQRRFAFDEHWQPRLRTWESPLDGIALPARKFMVHRFGVKGNDPYGLGMGTRLFWPVLFKREGIAFWLTFLEKFASPIPIGKYPLGTLPSDQDKLLSTLEGMVQAGAIVVPIGTDVSFMEATRAGQVSYADWCRYWDTQMSLAVFGSSLATHVEGQGSRAAAETHQEGEERIVDADADLLTDTLSRTLIRWLVEFNEPGARIPAVRRIRAKNESAHEDLRKKRAENAKAELDLLFDLAAKVPAEHFAETAAALAGIDLMPQVPIEVLRQLAPHLAAARQNLVAAARSGQLRIPANGREAEAVRQIAFAGNDFHDHGLRDLAEQLSGHAGPAIDAMIEHIRRELEAADAAGETLEQAGDRLLGAFANITVDPLGRVLAPAFALGELTGRSDVQDEIAARKRKR
ncbi:DUF935 domain-containing protein [Phreatobacter stygius]|uniref:DUF935 family protein n=1 Tax=Phreatobacter stygius TaxID=1940610 RepID=A0A4D7B651_9HYPH|nr:DUF935 family protein [Phreatobacter stygius]QCI65640.1 DUF935 family protein [Phreatobacter stygius]